MLFCAWAIRLYRKCCGKLYGSIGYEPTSPVSDNDHYLCIENAFYHLYTGAGTAIRFILHCLLDTLQKIPAPTGTVGGSCQGLEQSVVFRDTGNATGVRSFFFPDP